MKTNLKDLTRDDLKSIANQKGISFKANIPIEKLRELIEEYKEPDGEVEMKKPSDGKQIRCIVRNLDPQNPMTTCEVGTNGYFLSIPLDKEVTISDYFFGTIKSAYWVKPITDENGQVIRTEKRKTYTIEIV